MMPRNIFSIWKIALFGGLLAFTLLFWLNDHVGYEAKSAILVKQIGNKGTTTDDTVAKTIAAFAETDTFRERTLSSKHLQEGFVGQMDSDAQNALLKNAHVKGGKQGGLITVTAYSPDADVAALVSEESTETLVRMSRLYLGSTEELSLIIIDQPIVSKAVIAPVSYGAKVAISTFVLFLIALVSQPFFFFVKREIKGKLQSTKETELTSEVSERERDERFVPQKLDPTFLYPEREANIETLPVYGQPKASEILKSEVYGEAPKNNLQSVSVAMDDLPFSFETTEPEDDITPQEDNVEQNNTIDREPTVLEYKRRLNELLSQK